MFKKILAGLGIAAAVGLVLVLKPFTQSSEKEPEEQETEKEEPEKDVEKSGKR